MSQTKAKKARARSSQCLMISFDGSVEDDCVVRYGPCEDDEIPQAHLKYTAWIPKKKAIVGKWLKIDDMEGNWQVRHIGATKESVLVHINSRDHLSQRKASDV